MECLVELLEHSDQKVRIGACTALGHMKVSREPGRERETDSK